MSLWSSAKLLSSSFTNFTATADFTDGDISLSNLLISSTTVGFDDLRLCWCFRCSSKAASRRLSEASTRCSSLRFSMILRRTHSCSRDKSVVKTIFPKCNISDLAALAE